MAALIAEPCTARQLSIKMMLLMQWTTATLQVLQFGRVCRRWAKALLVWWSEPVYTFELLLVRAAAGLELLMCQRQRVHVSLEMRHVCGPV